MAENGFAEGYAVGRDTNGNGYGYGYPVMPMYPVYSNGNNGYGFGDWIWIIVLFALFGGGFGGMGFGGFGGGLGIDFPWILNGQNGINNNTNAGFRDAALSGKLDSISTQLCSNELNSLQTAYEYQISSLQQSFAMQQAFNTCCCENRLGIADLKATVISENCADREALSNGIRDIISAQTAGTQRVLDQLCNDKIDAKNEKIADLERQLTMANLAASQTAQTARILAGQTAEVDALYNRLSTCPVGTMPVYGNQPIFTCPNNNNTACGCGCGNN